MFISTYLFNQTQGIQDKNILSGPMLTNTLKNTLILTVFNTPYTLDELLLSCVNGCCQVTTPVDMCQQTVDRGYSSVDTVGKFRSHVSTSVIKLFVINIIRKLQF